MLRGRGGLGRREVHGLGHEEALRLDGAREDPLAQMLVEHALVQGVLVDDHHPVVALGHQVAIVELHGLDAGG